MHIPRDDESQLFVEDGMDIKNNSARSLKQYWINFVEFEEAICSLSVNYKQTAMVL